MSEELTGATISMAEKAISGSIEISVKTVEALIALMKLLNEMNEASQKRAERKFAEKQQAQKEVVQTDLMQKLKMKGQVSLSDLREYAAKNNEQIIYSEQALTKEDVAQLTKNAKSAGIPIAFLHQKDKKTYYPVVCASDAEPFKLIIKNKDPDQKETGLSTMIAGFVVVAICAAVDMFNLFQ